MQDTLEVLLITHCCFYGRHFFRNVGEVHKRRIAESHDWLLQSTLEAGTYRKLYSFHQIVNGFAIHTTPSQVIRSSVKLNLIGCVFA
jgi:Peptidase inhibitor I9